MTSELYMEANQLSLNREIFLGSSFQILVQYRGNNSANGKNMQLIQLSCQYLGSF